MKKDTGDGENTFYRRILEHGCIGGATERSSCTLDRVVRDGTNWEKGTGLCNVRLSLPRVLAS